MAMVVYEWNGITDWKSVVISGELTEIETDRRVEMAEVYTDSAAIPDLSVFNDDLENLDVVWYELQIESITGRQPSP